MCSFSVPAVLKDGSSVKKRNFVKRDLNVLRASLRLFFQLSDHLCALVKFISKPRRTLIVISPLRVQTECFGFF